MDVTQTLKSRSSMDGSFRTTQVITLVNANYINLLAGFNSNVHPFMFIPKDGNSVFVAGIERLYNLTQGIDLLPYVIEVDDYNIVLSTDNNSAIGDKIETTFYIHDRDYFFDSEPISADKVDLLYRSAGNMDRCDFGNWSPTFNHAANAQGESLPAYKYITHPTIIFNEGGWPSRVNPSIRNINQSLSSKPKTVIDFSPSNAVNIGMAAGDAQLTKRYIDGELGVNTYYSKVPIPFYITGLNVYTRYYNDFEFATDGQYKALKLDIDIDGMKNAITNCPGLVDSDGRKVIVTNYGNDKSYYVSLGMYGDQYGGIPPMTAMGEYRWEEAADEYGSLLHVHYSIEGWLFRARSLKVTASVVGWSEDNVDLEIPKWFIGFSGWIPMGSGI